MTNDQAVVEAVAKALYNVDAVHTGNNWVTAHPDVKRAYYQDARAAVAAMTVHGYANRAEVAEEVARAIEAHYLTPTNNPIPAGRRELIENVARFSARIAREIGERA